MIFLDNYYIFDNQRESFTYISSIEVNSINIDQHILLSYESEMGRKCGDIEKFKMCLIKNGFEKTIWVDDFGNYHDLYNLVCHNNKKLKKIR